MKRFTISILLFFSLLFASYIAFATTPIENGAAHVGNAVKDTVEGSKNIAINAGNTIGNGIKNGANAVSESGEKAMNSMKNTSNSIIGSVDSNYTTARTAADVTVLGMTTNTWTWIIIAIVGIAIVGLVWYYGAQYEHKDFDNE